MIKGEMPDNYDLFCRHDAEQEEYDEEDSYICNVCEKLKFGGFYDLYSHKNQIIVCPDCIEQFVKDSYCE